MAQQGKQYAELCVTSNFSFLRSGSHPEEFVQAAAALGYDAIGIADVNTLAGVVRAHVAAKEVGIKLLIGTQLALYREIPKVPATDLLPPEVLPEYGKELLLPFSLYVYPRDRLAYAKLSRLLTTGKLRAPKGSCFLTLEDFCLAASGHQVIVVLHNYRDSTVQASLRTLAAVVDPGALSLAIWNNYGPETLKLQTEIRALSRETRLPLVSTNHPLYHAPERRMLQDALSCIRQRLSITEAGFLLAQNSERHLKSVGEMHRLFRHEPEALRRTMEIADTITFSLSELHYEYPHEICPEGMSPFTYLEELTWRGAAERYPKGVPLQVREQIAYEFELIRDLKYEKYFLTVYDIVIFARSRGILCQGRGAAANSAVCFCLGITSVDPEQMKLLIERFISRERNEPPDIDIDFEHERREEVIQYIYGRFGRARAALVAEVICYRTRLALRDLGRTFSLPIEWVETLIKIVTRADGEPITAETIRAAGLDPGIAAIHHTLSLAQVLSSFPRHLSQHVGGFVVSEARLDEIVPIENAGMPDRTIIEWDKDDIEALQMLKIDVLALGMLTCIRKALGIVNASRAPGTPEFELHTVEQEDPAVYDMLCRADTIGVFQIESRAQMSMLPRLLPRTFYDLVIEVAIVRPGPIQGGMVHPFLRRRSGEEKVSFPNDRIRAVLERTLGVPIFQEQAMELAIVAAGFTPGEADELRRAIASWKRKKNLLRKFRTRLVGGMLANGYTQEFAEQCFQQICGFGEYGFPQSHAASFALLVYVSAWLKKHHPAAFAAGLLNSQPMGFYQPAQIVDDAKRHGVLALPIDAQLSEWDCVVENGVLRLGMRLVRGLREDEVTKIVKAVKRHGKFSTITKLWQQSGVFVSTLERLARADAFGSFRLTRQQALWEIRRLRDERLPLFEKIESQMEAAPELPTPTELQEVFRDYQHTSLSLKNHPIWFLREHLNQLGAVTSEEIRTPEAIENGREVSTAGIVLVRQRPSTASGVVFLTLEDESGFVNLVVFPNIFRRYRSAICDSVFLLVSGRVQRQGIVTHLIVDTAQNLGNAYERLPSMSRDFH